MPCCSINENIIIDSIDNHNRISLESLENLHYFNICEKNNCMIMMFLYWDNEFPVYRVMSFWLRSRLYKLCSHISNLIKCKYHFELYLKQIITLCTFQLRQADEIILFFNLERLKIVNIERYSGVPNTQPSTCRANLPTDRATVAAGSIGHLYAILMDIKQLDSTSYSGTFHLLFVWNIQRLVGHMSQDHLT